MKTEELLEQMNEIDEKYLMEYSEGAIKTQRKGFGRKRQSIIAGRSVGSNWRAGCATF